MDMEHVVAWAILIVYLIVGLAISSRIRLSKLKRIFPEMFSDATSIHCHLLGSDEIEFCHCGMDGRVEGHSSRSVSCIRIILHPKARSAEPMSEKGLTIDAGVKQDLSLHRSDLQHVKSMDEEYFKKHCDVKCGGMTIPGSDLPKPVLQLLRKIGGLSCPKFSVYCAPDRFEIFIRAVLDTPEKNKEFIAASLLLLKELVHLRVDGLPMEELNLPAAYGEVEFSNDKLLSKSVKEYLNDAMTSFEDVRNDPLLSYLSDASGMGTTDDGIYDELDGDAGRAREKVVQDDAHALQEGKSRWIE